MKNLIRNLKAQGVPIDGVGLQAHFIVGQVPTTLVQNMNEFAALGVEIAITELDVRIRLPETAALRQQQQRDFQTVVAACQAVRACVGITIWDFTDRVRAPGVDGARYTDITYLACTSSRLCQARSPGSERRRHGMRSVSSASAKGSLLTATMHDTEPRQEAGFRRYRGWFLKVTATASFCCMPSYFYVPIQVGVLHTHAQPQFALIRYITASTRN